MIIILFMSQQVTYADFECFKNIRINWNLRLFLKQLAEFFEVC